MIVTGLGVGEGVPVGVGAGVGVGISLGVGDGLGVGVGFGVEYISTLQMPDVAVYVVRFTVPSVKIARYVPGTDATGAVHVIVPTDVGVGDGDGGGVGELVRVGVGVGDGTDVRDPVGDDVGECGRGTLTVLPPLQALTPMAKHATAEKRRSRTL